MLPSHGREGASPPEESGDLVSSRAPGQSSDRMEVRVLALEQPIGCSVVACGHDDVGSDLLEESLARQQVSNLRRILDIDPDSQLG
jgi:hypothetical protein